MGASFSFGGVIFEFWMTRFLFSGFNHFEWIDDQWVWKGTVGSSQVRGAFYDGPFLFELTDHVNFDYHGYNAVVGHNVYSGTKTNVWVSIFLMGDANADGDVDGSDLAAYIIDPEGIELAAMAENFGKHES